MLRAFFLHRAASLRPAAVFPRNRPLAAWPLAFGVWLLAGPASAHIELLEPASRYTSNGNKSCPCGAGDSNRQCDVTAEESTDDNRSTDPDLISTFEVGSTITVRFDEYIGHSGRFRVAFDPDGANLADFNEHILADIPDPSDGRGIREMTVTLPDEPCDNCTLQVIQAMHGDTENPVLDPAPLSTYYACADLVLVPKGALDGAAGGSGADAGALPPLEDGGGDDDGGGCSASSRTPAGWGGLALLGLALGTALRRRGR